VICEIVTLELPVFVIVTSCAAEVVFVTTFPKVRLVGLMLRVNVAAIPVPLSVTFVGEVGALLTIEMLPEAAPTSVGRNPIEMFAVFPAFTFNGSVKPLALNAAPVGLICVIVSVAVPEFVMIKVCEVSTPTTSFPKFMVVELT
jgi:hypothetical protein